MIATETATPPTPLYPTTISQVTIMLHPVHPSVQSLAQPPLQSNQNLYQQMYRE